LSAYCSPRWSRFVIAKSLAYRTVVS
jgi:hypothetical protein